MNQTQLIKTSLSSCCEKNDLSNNKLHTLICLVLFTSDVTEILTKRGETVRVVTLNVADPTLSGFVIKLWGDRTEWIRRQRIKVGDIIRLTSVKIKHMKYDRVAGSTTYHSHSTPLYRHGEYIHQMNLSLQFAQYLHDFVEWSNVQWKGLSELSQEGKSEDSTMTTTSKGSNSSSSSSSSSFSTSHSSSSAASSAIISKKRKRQKPDSFDHLSDQKVINIVAYLRHVHPPPKKNTNVPTKGAPYGVAILGNGKHSEIALKLWNHFSNPQMIELLKENVGKMIECKNVSVRHCPYLETKTLNTMATSNLKILTTKQSEKKTFQVTPSAPDTQDNTQDDGDEEEEGEGGVNDELMSEVHHGKSGMKKYHNFLGIDHLLTCSNHIGIVQLECLLDHFSIDHPQNETINNNISHSNYNDPSPSASPSSSSSSSSSTKTTTTNTTMHNIVTKVCIKCNLNMIVDRNNITSCPGNCPPLQHNDSLSTLPYKWSYRNGTMTLRDCMKQHSVLKVSVNNEMVQHLIVGIPPLALVKDEKESSCWYESTRIKPAKVVTKILDALKRPGLCKVRVQIKCTITMDHNGMVMHEGRMFELISFDVL